VVDYYTVRDDDEYYFKVMTW